MGKSHSKLWNYETVATLRLAWSIGSQHWLDFILLLAHAAAISVTSLWRCDEMRVRQKARTYSFTHSKRSFTIPLHKDMGWFAVLHRIIVISAISRRWCHRMKVR
jgi:hypothetical protein